MLMAKGKYGMGWIPDYPDFRDYTEKTSEIQEVLDLRKPSKPKNPPVIGVVVPVTGGDHRSLWEIVRDFFVRIFN